MAFTGKTILRVIIVLCVVLIALGDYSGLIDKIFNQEVIEGSSNHGPRPSNPGYGDAKPEIDLDADIEEDTLQKLGPSTSKLQILSTIKNACLPKLICELNATPQKEKLTESERSLLSLIRDTSITATAELTSKYHFAAHMGQLIAGVDGNGCHNFYPSCPFPGLQVLQMMKKVRMR
ncbi:uncharacterized protein [Onthophagus taurus]|uniref:uncharacterized protein n=1 Tax=Onthophagus taurus TaxID=166361 RepID=UPI000C2009F2|nr:uncharacterized protein LOC111425628 [Onthophagus taurus]